MILVCTECSAQGDDWGVLHGSSVRKALHTIEEYWENPEKDDAGAVLAKIYKLLKEGIVK